MASHDSIDTSHEQAPVRPPPFVPQLPFKANSKDEVIRKVLIANRGEIARRIIKTCRLLHVKTIAIYVEEDRKSRYVDEATQAIDLGSIDEHATSPFLNIALILQIASDNQVDAIHPGYGYLSENDRFASECQKAGMIFVGPGPMAMSTLGDKRKSKAYLREHAPEIPLIPGFTGSSVQGSDLEKAAAAVGYPIMLKASAGGGGKGMRIVREPGQLLEELERAQSEAFRSFGSSDCILEKYIESSKHVEIQILGDRYGHVVSFLDRECSVQRRHQKVVEETPCSFLSDITRHQMSSAATRIAQLIGYENAGTVEFVVDVSTSKFYFLEVNTRLQVEHPITEEVTGFDLVAMQLYVASGGSLRSIPQLTNIKQSGHAIECRLCAENPDNDFFPDNGTIHLWREARLHGSIGAGRDVRYETSVTSGSSVPIHFDSMIAKLVVWAPTRDIAIQRMTAVLSETACAGVMTNQLFLQRCLQHRGFQDVRYTTSFIADNLNSLLRGPLPEGCLSPGRAESILASFFMRNIQSTCNPTLDKRSFSDVRTQFRNQRFDPVNVHCDVLKSDLFAGESQSGDTAMRQLCLWTSSRSLRPSHLVSTHALPRRISQEPECSTDKRHKPVSAARLISDEYNDISRMLRTHSLGLRADSNVKLLTWTTIHDTGIDPSCSFAAF